MYKTLLLSLPFILLGSLLPTRGHAQITSPDEFLPHRIGETFTPHHMLVDYYELVANESPRAALTRYGYTNEDRPLLLATVSTPENLARIDAIRENNLRRAGLLEGATDPELDEIAIVWLSFSVHGNEAAGSEASMRVLHELANPQNSRTGEWLKNTVVLLDPSLNPDGYNRYTNWYRQHATKRVDPNPAAREHNEPWPGGRVNHYLFDLNRDWAWQTQVESRQRMQQYNRWMPHIHADLHEQGYTSPYYFAPAAAPFHEYITEWQTDFQTEIGRNHANYFDRAGWLYFTRERFDLLYPSYGDTWPTFNGAIGMTYEQAGHSRAGRAIDLPTGDTLTLFDRVEHHTTTALSTVEIASDRAEDLVSEFGDYFIRSMTEPQGEYVTYLVKAGNAPGKLRALAELLDRNGISYSMADEDGPQARMYDYRGGKEQSARIQEGDMVITAFQPKSVLLQTLFDPSAVVEDSVTYDITAWSVPLAYGLEAYASTQQTGIATRPFRMAAYQSPFTGKDLSRAYAFVAPWSDLSSARYLAALLDAGIRVRTAGTDFVFGEREFPAGSIVVNKGDNRKTEDFLQKLQRITTEHEIALDVLETGFSTSVGGDLGGSNYELIEAPRVAVLSGERVRPNEFGQVWYYFEQDLDYPISIYYADDVDDVAAGDYNVLILPEGRYELDDEKMELLTNWVRRGGKLIAIGSANASLAGKKGFGLERKKMEEDSELSEEEKIEARLQPYAGQERRFIEGFIPGAVVGLEMDDTHPLSFGLGEKYYSLKVTSDAYAYLENGWNVGRVRENPYVTGFVGNQAYEKIQETLTFGVKPIGRGQVIYLIDNPLYRAFWYNGKLLFANALFQVH